MITIFYHILKIKEGIYKKCRIYNITTIYHCMLFPMMNGAKLPQFIIKGVKI